jgi:hypothetical protein
MMRAALPLLFATGCQLVFSLDDNRGEQIVQRRTSLIQTAGNTYSVSLDLGSTIEEGDLVIATIQARQLDDVEISVLSPGWKLIAEEEALDCPGQFHVWFLQTIVTAGLQSEFEFMPDNADSPAPPMDVITTAYSGASSARLLDFKLMGPLQMQDPPVERIAFAEMEIEPGSMVWFGGGALSPWTDLDRPVGTQPIQSLQQLAAFELAVPSGALPEVELPNRIGDFCADVAQIAVEP